MVVAVPHANFTCIPNQHPETAKVPVFVPCSVDRMVACMLTCLFAKADDTRTCLSISSHVGVASGLKARCCVVWGNIG